MSFQDFMQQTMQPVAQSNPFAQLGDSIGRFGETVGGIASGVQEQHKKGLAQKAKVLGTQIAMLRAQGNGDAAGQAAEQLKPVLEELNGVTIPGQVRNQLPGSPAYDNGAGSIPGAPPQPATAPIAMAAPHQQLMPPSSFGLGNGPMMGTRGGAAGFSNPFTPEQPPAPAAPGPNPLSSPPQNSPGSLTAPGMAPASAWNDGMVGMLGQMGSPREKPWVFNAGDVGYDPMTGQKVVDVPNKPAPQQQKHYVPIPGTPWMVNSNDPTDKYNTNITPQSTSVTDSWSHPVKNADGTYTQTNTKTNEVKTGGHAAAKPEKAPTFKEWADKYSDGPIPAVKSPAELKADADRATLGWASSQMIKPDATEVATYKAEQLRILTQDNANAIDKRKAMQKGYQEYIGTGPAARSGPPNTKTLQSVNIPATVAKNMTPAALGYATTLAQRYKFKYQPDELWRPAGTVKGETGIHADGDTFDIPVDPNTTQGKAIAARIRADGYYALTDHHASSTGPHIHVEMKRNASGNPRQAQGAAKSQAAAKQPNPQPAASPTATKSWLDSANVSPAVASILQRYGLYDEVEA